MNNEDLVKQWQDQKRQPYTLGKCTDCGDIVKSSTLFTICDKCWNSNPTYKEHENALPPELKHFLKQ